MPQPQATAYEQRQDNADHEYKEAWKSAPESFKKAVARLNIDAKIDRGSQDVIAYEENYEQTSYEPDLADEIDTVADRMVEKYGAQNEKMIRNIVDDLMKPMEEEAEKRKSLILGRVACFLMNTESGNMKVRVHQLLHAIPRLAVINGFRSMRESGKACGVSQEWIRRGRDEWCDYLGIPIPSEGRKSDEARAKYRENALTNHWRSQPSKPIITNTEPTTCKPNTPNQTNKQRELEPA